MSPQATVGAVILVSFWATVFVAGLMKDPSK